MKNIFMIGKTDAYFQSINSYLKNHFEIQICMEHPDMIRNIMNLKKPELIILCSFTTSKENEEILMELNAEYWEVPVICIGTETEQPYFTEYFSAKKFQMMVTPLDNENVLQVACEMLGMPYHSEPQNMITETIKKKSILLVDDDPSQLRMLNEMLKEKYEVQMATSGMKALALMGKKVPDIIFLDYEMPVCDGRRTLQLIRENDAIKNVPVVFLTGVREKEHIKAVLELHPAAYLLKPANATRIFETIENLLGK